MLRASDLELTEHRRRSHADRSAWRPFGDDDDDGRFNRDWWRAPWPRSDAWFVTVHAGDVEVARVQLDDAGVVNPDYVGAPAVGPGSGALEIQLLEVATDRRRDGIGTATVHALAGRFADRRLVALSEGGTPFWSSLGWERYDHPEGPQFYMPMFVQPRRQ